MKYLLSLVLASLFSSSLVFAQGRRHYGHELPIISGASAQNPIQTLSKGHDAPQETRDEYWDPTGNPKCNGIVYAISAERFSKHVIIGGEFDSIAGVPARSLAIGSTDYYDSTITELGGGTDGVVYAIYYIADTDIYVGGNFKHAGTVAAANIAHWNGTTWEALTFGTDTSVLALTVVADQLFVGGNFSVAGGVLVNHIAIWNRKTKNWLPIISQGVIGVDGGVAALASDVNGVVFVGGGFLTAGLDTVNKIVSIDKGWKALDGGVTGLNSFVAAISIDENQNSVTVGGSFSKADTIKVSNIATFGGLFGGWSILSNLSVNGPVYAISSHIAIIIGGDFTTAGGDPANHIAVNANTALGGFFGSGVDGPVYALAGNILFMSFRLESDDIFVGGDFHTAGIKPFPFFATFKATFGAVKEVGNESNNFRIYPNPASTEIAIENSESITELTLVDALGRSVLIATANQSKSPITTTNIPDGFYTAMITSGGKMYSRKVIIEH